ncbi:phosphotransferase family protein [Lentibacillus salicampi]|uniref:Aminoglycoside phosphotransferase family protein n=1 Tax=Lentibacillus salicampi TaxID=175306 RepID=A0A4Y9ABC2_9BACI|nr:aminoglycoside phosphotransferase family protein [Lentibacillus salicampi]TFJ92705.1 aminoglycoside phosphotransferase family protein [Lentibacillus salicampi]
MNANRLPDHVLQWVINTVDPNASVGAVYQLKGSTSSTLHSISLKTGRSVRHYVVRQFDNPEWLKEEPDLAKHEAASLQVVEKTGVVAPELIAYDATGEGCGVPAVLMTKLDGAVELKPDNMGGWLEGLAETLAGIHRVDATNFSYHYFPYNDSHSFEVPVWTDVPETWKKALDLVNSMKPSQKECLIHRDYHPANVLWNGGAVSGVVDWVNACMGPCEIDIGHCRLNLAMLYGTDTADAFLQTYQHYMRVHYHRYWDIIALINFLDGPPEVYPGWEAFGITGLTNHLMKERLDAFISHVTSSQTLGL